MGKYVLGAPSFEGRLSLVQRKAQSKSVDVSFGFPLGRVGHSREEYVSGEQAACIFVGRYSGRVTCEVGKWGEVKLKGWLLQHRACYACWKKEPLCSQTYQLKPSQTLQ